MIIDIRLQHFRSYTDSSFEFDPGVNIIVGPNASGKTNLLESLLVIARGSSYRARDSELIAFDEPWARLDALTDSASRVVKLEQGGDLLAKNFIIDEHPYTRLHLSKTLPVTLFEPNDLLLLSGSPELRRNFMDDLLEQTVTGYGSLRRQYKRTLAQRNALLKQGYEQAASQLFAWNIRLSELGGQLAQHRVHLVAQFDTLATQIYNGLSKSNPNVSLNYASKLPTDRYASTLLKTLESNTREDCIRGYTAYGPHRDDLAIVLNGQDALHTASRGESRTLLLMLKLLEAQMLETIRGVKPLLLLDDVFSELDGKRRQALTGYLKGYQTFITTTDADVVVRHFMDQANIIPLSKV